MLLGGFAGGCAAPVEPQNPAFPVTTEQADAATAAMRERPRALARPLVIVGGFWDFNISPPLFAQHFRQLTGDDRILGVSVGLCGSFAECRRTVIEAVDESFPCADPTWTTEVDVIGASLGGLVARYAAAPPDDPSRPRRLKIARLFTISSPHAGATLADAVALTAFHRDMCPGSEFLKGLAARDAEATYELYPYVLLGDEIVGQQHAAPPGRNPYWLTAPGFPLPHLAAMMDARILADIARRLRGEEPFTRGPAVPLPAEPQGGD